MSRTSVASSSNPRGRSRESLAPHDGRWFFHRDGALKSGGSKHRKLALAEQVDTDHDVGFEYGYRASTRIGREPFDRESFHSKPPPYCLRPKWPGDELSGYHSLGQLQSSDTIAAMSRLVCYIPSYNDSELVAQSLATVPEWEVVISDNASDPSSRRGA